MIETITNVNSFVNGIVWGWPALILLGFVGVLMTCMTKFSSCPISGTGSNTPSARSSAMSM